jgi:hypothetical protein
MNDKTSTKSVYDDLAPTIVLSIVTLCGPLANFVSGWPIDKVCELDALAQKFAATVSSEEMRERVAECVAVFRKRQNISHVVDQLEAAADRLKFSPSLHRASLAYVLAWFSVFCSQIQNLPTAAPEACSARR